MVVIMTMNLEMDMVVVAMDEEAKVVKETNRSLRKHTSLKRTERIVQILLSILNKADQLLTVPIQNPTTLGILFIEATLSPTTHLVLVFPTVLRRRQSLEVINIAIPGAVSIIRRSIYPHDRILCWIYTLWWIPFDANPRSVMASQS